MDLQVSLTFSGSQRCSSSLKICCFETSHTTSF